MHRLAIISPEPAQADMLRKVLPRVRELEKVIFIREYPSADKLSSLLVDRNVSTILVSLVNPQLALPLIEALNAAGLPQNIIAIGSGFSRELETAALRAGACDLLSAPFSSETLENSILQYPDFHGTEENGSVVSIIPSRGGCGASTVAAHIAVNMGRMDRKTLLLEFDSHTGTMGFRFRLDQAFTLQDALRRMGRRDDLWELMCAKWNGIHVLPSAHLDVRADPDYSRTPLVISSARRAFPTTVVDLPPAIYRSCESILEQSDVICLVCTPEALSIELARRKILQLRKLGVMDRVQLVLNRCGGPRNWDVKTIECILQIPLAGVLQNNYEAVADASLKNGLIADGTELAGQYATLTRHLSGAPAKRSIWPSSLNKLLSATSKGSIDQREMLERLMLERLRPQRRQVDPADTVARTSNHKPTRPAATDSEAEITDEELESEDQPQPSAVGGDEDPALAHAPQLGWRNLKVWMLLPLLFGAGWSTRGTDASEMKPKHEIQDSATAGHEDGPARNGHHHSSFLGRL